MVQEIYPGADMEAVRNRPFIKDALKENVKMFTAKDLHNKLKSLEECSGIDEWIEDVLYKEFIRFGSYAIISSATIGRNGWNSTGFTLEMRKRGFSLEYKSDQRDGDYYRITFPPQER